MLTYLSNTILSNSKILCDSIFDFKCGDKKDLEKLYKQKQFLAKRETILEQYKI